jgi:hypothetical protein
MAKRDRVRPNEASRRVQFLRRFAPPAHFRPEAGWWLVRIDWRRLFAVAKAMRRAGVRIWVPREAAASYVLAKGKPPELMRARKRAIMPGYMFVDRASGLPREDGIHEVLGYRDAAPRPIEPAQLDRLIAVIRADAARDPVPRMHAIEPGMGFVVSGGAFHGRAGKAVQVLGQDRVLAEIEGLRVTLSAANVHRA